MIFFVLTPLVTYVLATPPPKQNEGRIAKHSLLLTELRNYTVARLSCRLNLNTFNSTASLPGANLNSLRDAVDIAFPPTGVASLL